MASILSEFQFVILDANIDIVNWLIRIAISCVCGFVIGMERKSRSKEAGVRTHFIVCMACCVVMIVSKYGFSDLGSSESADGARLAAQVVSGIGFLGAGIIFYKRDFLHGLTTAAGVWATAGIGLAIGSGMIIIGVIATVALVTMQIALHKPWKWTTTNVTHTLKVTALLDSEDVVDQIRELFSVKKFLQFKTSVDTDGKITAKIELATVREIPPQEIFHITKDHSFIISVEKVEEL